jgi:hypothetical protein
VVEGGQGRVSGNGVGKVVGGGEARLGVVGGGGGMQGRQGRSSGRERLVGGSLVGARRRRGGHVRGRQRVIGSTGRT